MSPDEKAIRQVVIDWMNASKAGDVAKLGTLMAEDVVFLRAGCPPMQGREAFMTSFKQMKGVKIDGTAEPQEVHVEGNMAYMWNRLNSQVTPPQGAPIVKKGDVLTVYRKQPNGNWVLARDANLLS